MIGALVRSGDDDEMGNDDTSTVDQPVLAPHDHTLLLKVVHAQSAKIIAALGARVKKRPIPAQQILRAIYWLPDADDKTKHTAQQVLSFLDPLLAALLPASYADTLKTVDDALAAASHPMGVISAFSDLRDSKVHANVRGFQVGIESALDLIGDALETSGTMMTGVSVFGRRDPAGVAKACARGCVSGALAGQITGAGGVVGSVVGAVAGTVQAAITAIADNP
jgi:hypothetical protein